MEEPSALGANVLPASHPAQRLRRLADALDDGVLGPDGLWLASGLRLYLDEAARGRTLDSALALAPLPFCMGWWAAEGAAERGTLLCELAELLAAGEPAMTAARKIEAASRRYAGAAWPRERHAAEPPTDPVRARLWRLHRSGGRWPVGFRTIFNELRVKFEPVAITLHPADLEVSKRR